MHAGAWCGRSARIFPSTTGPSRFRATYPDKTNSEGVIFAETFKTRVFHAYVLTNLSLVWCERLI